MSWNRCLTGCQLGFLFHYCAFVGLINHFTVIINNSMNIFLKVNILSLYLAANV